MPTAMKQLLRTAIILCLTLVVAANADSVTVNDHLVWCHYVAWHDWNQTPVAITNYYDFPLAHPTGDQQKDYLQEIDSAIRMGINGFVVDLVNGSAFAEQTLKLLQAARGTKFMVSVCLDGFDDSAPVLAEKVASFLQQAKEYPNLARIDGKPLLTTYAGDRGSAEYWKLFRKELAGRGFEVFLVVDANSPEKYPNCFDMLYCFNALDHTQFASSTLYPTLHKGAELTSSRKWMAGIGPGYIGPWPFSGRNEYYSGFRGFDQFWSNFEAAVKEKAAWIHLTTWNDLDETPLQPMAFQFHSYPELTRYWISRWQGNDKPAPKPRLYLAYQREQIIGTVQRIELISLPTVLKTITTALELRDINGKTLVKLSLRTFKGAVATRLDWAVPTAAFANTPVVEPVLHVQSSKKNYTRRLPIFVMRTGWIANKSNVRVPVHEISDGRANLTVKKDSEGNIQATVNLSSTEKVRSVTLWRNDRPLGSFTTTISSGVKYHLGFTYMQDTQLNIKVSGGVITSAYYTLDSAMKPDLNWSSASLSARFGRYRYIAAELSGNSKLSLTAVVDSAKPQSVTLAQLKQGAVDLLSASSQPVCRLFLAETDSTSVAAPSLNITKSTLTGCYYTKQICSNDLFYVRCETTDGRFFFSNAVAPFAAGLALVPTTILQTAETLDGGGVGGGGYEACFTKPPFTTPVISKTKVHPAMVQQMQWTFDSKDPWTDTKGWNSLHPGSPVNSSYYVQVINRTPALISRQDSAGKCIEFDGIDDVIEIPIRQMPSGAFTVSMDICPASGTSKEQSIIGHSGWQSCPTLRILPDGRLQGGRETSNDPKNNILATSTDPLPIGVWSHIQMTFNEQTVKLSINYKPASTKSGNPARAYGNLRIYLGADAAGQMFKGKLDNIQITSVAE